jgi:hypothetical protein
MNGPQHPGLPAGALLAIAIAVAPSALPAQGSLDLQGTVRDSAGAVLPSAQLAAFRVRERRATGPLRAAATDPRGHFELQLPGPGSYVLRVTRTGYCPRSIPVRLPASRALLVRLNQVPTRPCDLTESGCPYDGSDPCTPVTSSRRPVPHGG